MIPELHSSLTGVTKMMRAVRIHGGSGTVTLDQVEKPVLGAGDDVILKVAASGLCRTDLHTIDSTRNTEKGYLPSPFILGHENSGVIEDIGPDVQGFKKGDAVLLHPFITCGRCSRCRAGEDMHCKNSKFPGVDGTDGGFAEFMKTSERTLVKLQYSDDLQRMAPLADAGNTAYHAVRYALPKMGPDSTVLIFGVGGLGHFGIQLVRELTSSRVIAADISESGLKLASDLGVEDVLDSGKNSFVRDLMNTTGGCGADVILDFVSEGNVPDLAIKSAADGGLYMIVGYGGKLNVHTLTIMGKELTVRGSVGGTYNELCSLVSLVRSGRINPVISRYSLEKFSEAMEDLRKHQIRGRAVLLP